jgi:EVE domain-containing protein
VFYNQYRCHTGLAGVTPAQRRRTPRAHTRASAPIGGNSIAMDYFRPQPRRELEFDTDARDDPKNPTSAVVDLEFLGRFDQPVSRMEIKQSGKFNDLALVRQGRLSTMVVPEKFVDYIRSRNLKAHV